MRSGSAVFRPLCLHHSCRWSLCCCCCVFFSPKNYSRDYSIRLTLISMQSILFLFGSGLNGVLSSFIPFFSIIIMIKRCRKRNLFKIASQRADIIWILCQTMEFELSNYFSSAWTVSRQEKEPHIHINWLSFSLSRHSCLRNARLLWIYIEQYRFTKFSAKLITWRVTVVVFFVIESENISRSKWVSAKGAK